MYSLIDDALTSSRQVADLITEAFLSPQLSAALQERPDLVASVRRIEGSVASTAARVMQNGLTLGPKNVWF
jgi:hypothetical protein